MFTTAEIIKTGMNFIGNFISKIKDKFRINDDLKLITRPERYFVIFENRLNEITT